MCSEAVCANDALSATVIQFPLKFKMPSNSVRCIYQDKTGYIWLGSTDGLCRYDGYRVLVYRSNPANRTLLSNNDVTSLFETRRGDLLVGTARGMNILNENRTKISMAEMPELRDFEIRAFVEDDSSNVWVGTYQQLVKLSPDYSRITLFEELPKTSVNDLHYDKNGNLWVAFWAEGIYRYDFRRGEFVALPPIGQRNNPRCFYPLPDGSFIVTTWGDGLWKMYPDRPADRMFEPIKVVSGDADKVSVAFGIVQDKDGYFWLVGNLGLSIVSISGKEMRIVESSQVSDKMNNVFSSIMLDREEDIWISAFGEVAYMIRRERPMVKPYPLRGIKAQTGGLSPFVTTIYKDGDGDIWLNQNRWGLGIYDEDNKAVRFYNEIAPLASAEGLETVKFIKGFADEPDVIYVGCTYAPYVYKIRKSGASIKIEERWDLSDAGGEMPLAIDKDKSGNVWILTREKVIVRLPDGRYVETIKGDDGSNSSAFKCDDNGDVWIGSGVSGMVKISNFSVASDGTPRFDETRISGIPGESVVKLDIDNVSGKVWGVSEYGDVFTVEMATGAVADKSAKINATMNGAIQNFVISDNGILWLTTNSNVYKYDPQTGSMVVYTSKDDEHIQSIIGDSKFYDPPGDLYLGGSDGIICFHAPSQLFKEISEHSPLFTDVVVNGQSCFLSSDNGIKLDNEAREIILPSNASNVELHFSTLNHSYPENVLYSYRLKGVDNDWVEMRDGSYYAFYNHLPKGDHTLQIRATNSDGKWAENVVSYRLVRREAWYETWWAEIVYVLLVVGIAWGVLVRLKRRMELREKLHQAEMDKRNIEEMAQMKLRYFTNISHDFLTPITIVNCLIDDLEMTYGKAASSLDKMRFNLAKLRRLIQEVLDYRKFENGKMRLNVAKGDIVSFIEDVCRNHFDPLMAAKHINFTINNSSSSLPAYFDSDKLEKIIFNLVSNAYKYTDEGGAVELVVGSETIDGKRWATIAVKDNGRGISSEDLPHIFDLFYSPHVSSQIANSNGIGLSLVKDLVEMHHAVIEVKSAVGVGTEFTLKVPIDRDSYSDDEMLVNLQPDIEIRNVDAADIDSGHVSEVSADSKATILLVEDNEELLALMSKIFMRTYNVLTAHNGVEALALAQSNDIDLVVSDLMMPEMDGLEFCRKMKSDIKTSHIPLILLTAKNRTEDRINCYNAGADGYIAKPFELKVLQARIDNFLSNRNSTQAEFRESQQMDTGVLEMSAIDKEFMERAVKLVKDHIDDSNLDIDMMTRELCVSRASLYRKIKALTGLSPVELVRNLRLKHSYELLKEGTMSIASVAYASGFSNPKYYSTCFKEQFGISPRDVQRD